MGRKYLGAISDPKDLVTKEYVDGLISSGGTTFYNKFEYTYVTSTVPVSIIPIGTGILNFSSADIMFVDINGLDLIKDVDYTVSGSNIILTTPISLSGQNVHFVVFRAVNMDEEVDPTFIVNDSVPIGAIQSYGGSTAPSGWLICDGSAISRTAYPELFAVIGTTYGSGDGSTTFNIPDLKGRVITGVGTCDGVTYNRGDKKSAGIPNLTGQFRLGWPDNSGGGIITPNGNAENNNGVFGNKHSGKARWTPATNESDDNYHASIMTFSASGSNSHYGASSTVQPNTTVANYIIKAKDFSLLQANLLPMLDFFYPVGTEYRTANANFNPNNEWGGTWTHTTTGDFSDTGWISLIPYLNTGFAGRSTDVSSQYCPAYRIYNNVVYFRGFIYSTTAKNSNAGTLCTNLPSDIRVGERGGGSVRFQGSAYHIRVESSSLIVYDTATIAVQAAHQGYHLACLTYVLGESTSPDTNIHIWKRTA